MVVVVLTQKNQFHLSQSEVKIQNMKDELYSMTKVRLRVAEFFHKLQLSSRKNLWS